ncbi:MAG: YdeI/OmpD-associated family protein [Bacteroidota bacterium]
MSDFHFFAGPVLREDDTMGMHYVPVPEPIAAALLAAGHRRVEGTLEERPFTRALHGSADDARLRFGKSFLKECGLAWGATAHLDVRSVADPNAVTLPEELVAALAEDEEAATRFETFTPGKQRSLAHHVTSAKRTETRERRAYELARKIRTYTLHGDTPPGS